jgi:hypothetical protein
MDLYGNLGHVCFIAFRTRKPAIHNILVLILLVSCLAI